MIITKSTHNKFNSKYDSGAFLVAVGVQNLATYISNLETVKSDISLLLNMITNLTETTFKVVGKAEFIDLIEKELAIHRLKLAKKITIAYAWEVIFHPEEGKLLISRFDSKQSVREFSQINQRNEKIRVLIVDDSLTVRKILRKTFSSDPNIEVVAEAEKPSDVDGLIQQFKPHVITLDIQMPEMDGVELLKIIFPKYKIPTVMISSMSMAEGSMVLNALEVGAVDYIQKPTFEELKLLAPVFVEKIKSAANAKIVSKQQKTLDKNKVLFQNVSPNQLIVIGSSTGGTEALREILVRLPANIPPILIVQHIPPIFSKAFADRLNNICDFEVREAQNGDTLKPSQVLIAPGGKQMKFVSENSSLKIEINDDPPFNRHKPSVDYLFNSVAEHYKHKVLGIILTGMGADGANGLLKLKQAGAWTIAQNEESCVVFGMPRVAIGLGAHCEICSLQEIPERMASALSRKSAA